MAEFGDKYNGDVQACLRGMQKDKLGTDVGPIDRTAMKRKWAASHENDALDQGEGSSKDGGQEGNPAKSAKNRESYKSRILKIPLLTLLQRA